MGGSGATVVDFGPFPGQSDVVATITGQAGIVAGSEVEAWIEPLATAAGYTADGYPFDGTRTLNRGGNLTGIVASATGIMSAWLYDTSGTYSSNPPHDRAFPFFSGEDNVDIVNILVGQSALLLPLAYQVVANNATSSQIFQQPNGVASGDAALAPDGAQGRWLHFLASWDVAGNVGAVYINDRPSTVFSRNLNQTVPYASCTDWGIGADALGSGIWRGAIADLYFTAGTFLDLTVTANRRKFNQVIGDGTLRPIDLGATGSGPTGTQPLVYLHMDHGADPATFLTNKGSGGNFARLAGSAPIAGQALPLCIAPGHSADEHELETIAASADKSSIIAGTGFNIRVFNTSQINEPLLVGAAGFQPVGGRGTRLCGKYNIGWAWN